MASITAAWTVGSIIASSTLDSTESTTGTLDLNASGFDMVHIQPAVTFGLTPDSVTTVEVFASTDQTTGTLDTIALTAVSIENETSTTKRVSLLIQDVPFIQVKMTNGDSADTVTAAQVRYAARKWISA